ALEMSGATQGSLILAAPDGMTVVASRVRGAGVTAEIIDDAQLARVARSGSAAFSGDRANVVVPMASGEGITVLLSLSRPGHQFSNQDLFAVEALSGTSAVAMANALRYHRSTQEATTDGLTGLFNVRELRRRLDAALARA